MSDIASILANLDVSFGNVTKTIEKAGKQQREALDKLAQMAEAPTFQKFKGALTLPASGFGVVPLNQQGPPQGYMWHVKKLTVSGSTPTAIISAATRLDIYVTAADMSKATALTQFDTGDWQDQSTEIPLVGAYGEGELFLRAGERLWTVVSSGTAGQILVVAGTAMQVQEAAFAAQWSM